MVNVIYTYPFRLAFGDDLDKKGSLFLMEQGAVKMHSRGTTVNLYPILER